MDHEQIVKTVASAWDAVQRDAVRNGGAEGARLVGYYQGTRDLAVAMGVRWGEISPALDAVDAEWMVGA